MFLFDWLRSFLPLRNPLGFGASDFLLLLFTGLLATAALLWRPWLDARVRLFAKRPLRCLLLLLVLPVLLRLALLAHHPVPTPDIYDEFGHLLLADTLQHFRLANPPHALPQFFETQFVLQEPTYSSIYPPGQGMLLALGWTLFGLPWAGVILGVAAFCALCYWMLLGWTTPGWALAGGLLAVMEFGPLSYWMNSYWGGAAAAGAGCLVFGALPRVAANQRHAPWWLGIGLGLQLLIRPFESILLGLSVLLYCLRGWRRFLRPLALAAVPVLAALGIVALQNKQVTGSWVTLPYSLSRYQYGVPAAFTFQPNPEPHRELNREQALNYRMQLSFRGQTYLQRLEYRVRFYRFFFLAPLYLAAPAFLWRVREYRFAWVLLTLAIVALGTNFYPNFEAHYIAGITCLFILISVTGLQQWMRWRHAAGRLIAFACVAQFVFWYGMHLLEAQPFALAALRYETWDGLNHGNPAAHIAVNQQLAAMPGKLLVFVRYYPQHIFQDEWVYNRSDIDGSRVVWARDLGEGEDKKLLAYYPDRTAWLLEPDFRPPRLRPYEP